mmetsp:Transcript_12590/g.30910  ORF Transcript_12590/g.30910 Transcript_12590/m.30910 type:complete len:372 (+) Transcript_12590:89-1204(+)
MELVCGLACVIVGSVLTLLAQVNRLHSKRMLRMVLPDKNFIARANAPIFSVDEHMKISEWNNKMQEITGCTKARGLGRKLVDCVRRDHHFVVTHVLKKALTGTETTSYEFPLLVCSGEVVDTLCSATTRRDERGDKVTGVVCVGQDIMQSKQAEKEKESLAHELRNLMETANAPIFGTDRRINEWNSMCAGLTQYPKDEVLGSLFVDYYVPAGAQRITEVLQHAFAGRDTTNLEVTMAIRGQAETLDILLNVTPRHNARGAIVGCIAIAQDVSSFRRLVAREAELAKVQSANSPKSEFLATMSHEMRTPLNVFGGMASVLLDTHLTTEQTQYADQVDKSCSHLLGLINDNFDLAKIVDRHMDLVSNDFNVR